MVKDCEKGGGTLHFSSVVMREIKNEEKSFFQKLTVKHNSNMRENYCKKLRWKRCYPIMVHSTLKGDRKDDEKQTNKQKN